MGYETSAPESFFDTVRVTCPHSKEAFESLLKRLQDSKINVRVLKNEQSLCVSFDETHTRTELSSLIQCFAEKNSVQVDCQKILESLPGKQR